MNNTDLVGRARVADDHEALTRLEQLLLRYPALDPDEEQETGTLLRDTRPLDMALLSTNTVAWAKAEQFRSDHPAYFRATWRARLLWLLTALAIIAAVLLLWDVGVE